MHLKIKPSSRQALDCKLLSFASLKKSREIPRLYKNIQIKTQGTLPHLPTDTNCIHKLGDLFVGGGLHVVRIFFWQFH